MSWIDDLINQIPAASPHRKALEALVAENAALKHESERLQAELNALKANAPVTGRLNAEAEKILLYVSREDYADGARIAQALSFSKKVLEMHVEDLLKGGFIETSYASENPQYYLWQKAKHYLHTYGLL